MSEPPVFAGVETPLAGSAANMPNAPGAEEFAADLAHIDIYNRGYDQGYDEGFLAAGGVIPE